MRGSCRHSHRFDLSPRNPDISPSKYKFTVEIQLFSITKQNHYSLSTYPSIVRRFNYECTIRSICIQKFKDTNKIAIYIQVFKDTNKIARNNAVNFEVFSKCDVHLDKEETHLYDYRDKFSVSSVNSRNQSTTIARKKH